MDNRTVAAAVITTDSELRTALRAALGALGEAVQVAVEIDTPFAKISREQMGRLREADPELVFVDLENDPELGIRLAQFLSDGNPGRRFVGFGPTLTGEQLIEAMRAGVTEYLHKPLTAEALEAAVQRIGRRLFATKDGPRQPGELFAVFSPKGGTGSTTVATNLAIHLQQMTGKKTLLVDLDLELGEIAVLLGMQPRFNFVDMIRNFHRMDAELLASYIEKHDSGVHLLSAPFHPERSETVTAEGIRKILQFLKAHYDYIVVDTSKSFGPSTLATFEQADRVFLLTVVDLPSLRNIKRCMPLLDRVIGAQTERVRLVVNRYQPDAPIPLEEAERVLGMDVYWTLANDYEAVIRSINSGAPVIGNEKSAFARDLRTLGAEITGLAPRRNGHRNRLSGMLKLLARK